MMQGYKTKTDINGNTYTLEIDHERKTYRTNAYPYASYIRITQKQRREMIEEAKREGYTCTDFSR